MVPMIGVRWLIPALILGFVALASACTDIDADYISDPDSPLYYTCSSDGDCESGFVCVRRSALSGEATAPDVVGLCLDSSTIGTIGDPAMRQCGGFLEARNNTRTSMERSCLLPFQCAGGGIELPGDVITCPLGFTCVSGPDSDCASCAFVSCNMNTYDADSATLVGIDNLNDGCLVHDSGDESPYAGATAGRVYCSLQPTGPYTSCPAGWT